MTQARRYEQNLRRSILQPLYRSVRDGLLTAHGAATVLAMLDSQRFQIPNLNGLAQREATTAMNRLQGYHQAKLFETFRQALGVDITGLLTEAGVTQFMQAQIAANVDLIRTIPPRFHGGLKGRLEKALRAAPFDQALVRGMLRDQYRASGYQLRRLTRDQTTKTIGGLTQVRHREMGIRRYRWLSSRDGRVRPTHAVNEGRIFSWDAPPAETGHPGHDVQCRCVATPIVPRVQKDPGPDLPPSTAAPAPEAAGKRNLKYLPGKGAYDPDGRRGTVIKTRNLGNEVRLRFPEGHEQWYNAADLRSISEFKKGVQPPKPKPSPIKRNLKFLPGKKAVTPDGRVGRSVATQNKGHRVQVEFPDGSTEWWDASELRSITEAKKGPQPKPDPKPPDPVNPWKPGDKVEMMHLVDERGTVVKIKGQMVQVRHEGGLVFWYHADALKRAPAPDKVKPKRNTKFLVGKTVHRPNGLRGKVTKTRNLGNEIFVEWDDGQSGWSQAASLRLPSEIKKAPKPPPPKPKPVPRPVPGGFKRGDRVVSKATSRVGTITRVDPDGQVWVRYDDDGSTVGPVFAVRFRHLTQQRPARPTPISADKYETVEGITEADAERARQELLKPQRRPAAATDARSNLIRVTQQLRKDPNNVQLLIEKDRWRTAVDAEKKALGTRPRDEWAKKHLLRKDAPDIPYEIVDMGNIDPHGPSPGRGYYKGRGVISPAVRAQVERRIEQAVEWFSRATHREWASTDRIRFYVSTNRAAGRAFARERNKQFTEVWIDPNAPVKTIVHEMGHALENLGKGKGKKRSVDYVYSRTQGEALQSIYGGRSERGRPDEFRDKYIGKEYATELSDHYTTTDKPWPRGKREIYGTELLSMGVEYMFDDPVAFARGDPGHFNWTLRELRRLQKGAAKPKPRRRPKPKPTVTPLDQLLDEIENELYKPDRSAEGERRHRARADFVDAYDAGNDRLRDYTGPLYAEVNALLRGTKRIAADKRKRLQEIIDFVQSKATKAAADETVYRVMTFKSENALLKAIGKVGDERVETSFWSSATSINNAFLAGGPVAGNANKHGVIMKLNKRKGTRQLVTNEREQEVILMPGTKITVGAIHKVEGKSGFQWVVEADVTDG